MVSELNFPASVLEKLAAVSLDKVGQLVGLSPKEFLQVEGITEEEAKQIVEAVKKI